MGAVFVGVRHHSPACARLVAAAIEEHRPAYVLVEGPADFNERIDELLLGHELPVALFSYSDSHASWSPFCDYSPEWVAITEGRRAGAEVRFIDLPAWHEAFRDVSNRYADAELRYAEVVERLCREFAVDNVDVLWDHLFESEEAPVGLAEYFDLLRGTATADAGDSAREAYMARWVRAALRKAGDRPVVVVTGGFHTPAIRALLATEPAAEARAEPAAGAGRTGPENEPGRAVPEDEAERTAAEDRAGRAAGAERPEPADRAGQAEPATGTGRTGPENEPGRAVPEDEAGWPEVPERERGASYLVPYSHARLDSFTGYQSGMPSPGYYQQVWETGPRQAADWLVESVATRLRARQQPVSTADLIAAHTQAGALARLRGHAHPARTDVLDGLTSALISEDLSQPPPWTRRGTAQPGAHPALLEMIAALRGDKAGRLHPDTPAPPLVKAVHELLRRHGLDGEGKVALDLTDAAGLERSRVLHRLRVLRIPGFERLSGPAEGAAPQLDEQWQLRSAETRLAALIEAAENGATLEEAAGAVLERRARDAALQDLAAVLFDAVLCGITALSGEVQRTLGEGVRQTGDLAALGRVLSGVLGLWRHDRLFGTRRDPLLSEVIDAGTTRVLWLVEGLHGGPAPADPHRLRAMAATRDAVLHARPALSLDPADVAGVALRVSADAQAPPDLRGAALGLAWTLGTQPDVGRVRGVEALGDWLAGLFAVAREEVLASPELVGVLDELVGAMTQDEFLVALPALRLAFSYFPPRERETIAATVLRHRGEEGSGRGITRLSADPVVVAEAMAVEQRVDALLVKGGLA
ncbi:hypothetical protein SAMN05216553_101179 [Lentzea fradiae]|uniref:Uncharacterized protein n=1 Tax=Lentzea fradiae TaxID=200378 RepID=A0A1G7KB37_9PSEU|nr:DUF5682 family protein [Lentzea fradiae]SDF34385.1 hypothetical protein SAMN05216553_101179 [Lentzea fradiae]